MRSRVFYKGHNSNWFDVLQGTRQGGVLSLLLYLCFRNDLLEELCKSTAGLISLALRLYVMICFLPRCQKEALMILCESVF